MRRIYSVILLLIGFILPNNIFAIEVVKYEYKGKIVLQIIRVIPDDFETYKLTNQNGREMTLVCAHNRFYENNPNAFIEYRNFYNELAGKFLIESDEICKDMATFIEQASNAVDEDRPFVITLNKKTLLVDKIVYPKVDPFSDTGNIQDLYLKPIIHVSNKVIKKSFENSKLTIKLN